MTFTDTQLEILYHAWLLAHDGGKGQVIEPWAYPDAHDLAEHGWLERREVDDGELAWFWTPQAEAALNVSELVEDAKDRVN